jgi:hypothetical protein
MAEQQAEVTAGGIARLAGVGRAAVSNWRRRHEDFPQPVGGTTTSPAFALGDVESWLRKHGKLAEVPARERAWQLLESDPAGPAEALVRAGDRLLEQGAAPAAGATPLERAVAALAAETGPAAAYGFLLDRLLDSGARPGHTPAPTAALMAALAGPGGSVLDPACGPCTLLAAAHGRAPDQPPAEIHGQEKDPVLARLGGLRLALRGSAAIRVQPGDSLLADAFAQDAVDTVLCHPPSNERHWGHDELAYDPRWEYGLPTRAESELAWVQHALARLRPGGTAVLLLPPAVASRRTGRRIRAALLRRNALRAVIALPAGAAPPHSLPLHLWILVRPGAEPVLAPRLLLMDTAVTYRAAEREGLDWPALRTTVLETWRSFREGRSEDIPGLCRALPVIDLLDDETDLAPARHLGAPVPAADSAARIRAAEELRATLGRTARLLPAADPAAPGDRPHWPTLTVGELIRSGAVQLHTASTAAALPAAEPGDVYVSLLPGPDRPVPQVVTEAGGPPPAERHLALLRPGPDVLDPWFLAGFLRGTGNTRQASSYASSATRVDVRRLKVPRLSLDDQRRYGRRFRELAAFEEALSRVAELGGQLVQGAVDGLTEGTLTPG